MNETIKPTGRVLELAVLNDPYYVKCILKKNHDGEDMAQLRKRLLDLIRIFDEKKMTVECPGCMVPARFVAYYKGTSFFELWCGCCSPYWVEHFRGQMDIFSSYISAIDYVDEYCYGDRFFLKSLIKNLARLKGLSPKIKAKEAKEFFRRQEEMRMSAAADLNPKAKTKKKKHRTPKLKAPTSMPELIKHPEAL